VRVSGAFRGVRRLGGFAVASAMAGVILAVLLLPVVGAAAWVAHTSATAFAQLPDDLRIPPPPERSTVRAADGSVIASFFRQNRIQVRLREVAPVLRDAVLAVEDARFYQHGPVDLEATARALVANIQAGEVREGGSTLTQQYVKNVRVQAAGDDPRKVREATEPTLRRKLQEVRYAVAVERRLSKDEILQRYLNIAYFGAGAYGVQAASSRYFSKPASKLSLPEAALLAGILKEPEAYDPTRDPRAARHRRNVVLDRMVEVGVLDPARAASAKRAGLGLKPSEPRNGCADSPYPFFCDYVLNEIRHHPAFGPDEKKRIDRLLEGGLTVQTTLDRKVQRAAQRAVDRHIETENPVAAAIVMIEPRTGEVKAIALNRKWGKGRGRTQVNYAVDRSYGGSAGFQAGSAFKPFVLAAALRRGLQPSLRIDSPARITVSGFRNCETGATFPPYPVRNYDLQGHGPLDMRQATWRSVNTYFVQLERRTGICEPAKIAESMGLRRADGKPLERYPSFVLGSQEVSPLRMAEAFGTFAARGMHCRARGIVKVAARDGRPVPLQNRPCKRALDARVAAGVTSILEGVIDGPDPGRTGARMSIGRKAAGKTGTTSNNVAVWFVGYTPELAAAVWTGYPDGSRPLRNVIIKGQRHDRLFGGRLPGPIWRDAIRQALD
jgi:membrane peptidoglycan carboxypeptidase